MDRQTIPLSFAGCFAVIVGFILRILMIFFRRKQPRKHKKAT